MDQPNPPTPTPPTPPSAPMAHTEPAETSFNVMPTDGNIGRMSVPTPSSDGSMPTPGGSRKWTYIIVTIIVLLALGGGAYYFLGSQKTNEQSTTSKLSKSWLQKYFNTEVCSDANCADAADPENDGLANYDEFKAGTNPVNPDSDGDGLADGDEVHIYKTEPNLKFTDRRETVAQNNWTDGFQVKNGFDPLTPAQKFTEARKKQIADDTAKFKLHEPSVTTLKTTTTPSPSPSSSIPSDWKTYTNTQYGFEFKYPSTVKVSESVAEYYGVLITPNGSSHEIIVIRPVNVGTESVFDKNSGVVLENTTFAGKTAKEYRCPEKNKCQTQFSSLRYIRFSTNPSGWQNGHEIAMEILKEESAEIKNTANQILSTFKFTK